MIKLSKRLQAVADFVTYGSRTADVGTDHGFLAIYLIQSGTCPSVLAMDVREGPLLRAREHIAQAGLSDVIQTRLSDGLGALAQGEADSVVIAGMGGLTMIKILEAAKGQGFLEWKELVLEPQSDLAKVRDYLRRNGMYTDRENLVQEDGKFYPILHVIPKPEPGQKREALRCLFLEDKIPDPVRRQELLDRYGEQLIHQMHPLLPGLLERDQQRRIAILKALADSGSDAKNELRRQEVEQELADIRVLLQYF